MHRLSTHLIAFSAALQATLAGSTLHAQNYREMPIGGRTATMGGAATAAGNDSAMPYLNPAGLAGVPGDIFAVSATVYSYTHRSVQGLFYPSGTDPRLGYELERERFATSSVGELPSSVMYFNHLNEPEASTHHHVGVSLVVPSARQVEILASVSGRFELFDGTALETRSIVTDHKRYYLGPTYAVGVGPSFRFGVTAFAAYYRAVVTRAQTATFSLDAGSTTAAISAESSQLSESLSFMPVVGAQLELVPHFWAGLGFSLPSLPVTGRLRFNANSSGNEADQTSGVPRASSSTSTADMLFSANDPLRLNFGVAYEARDSFSAAADVVFYAERVATQNRGVSSHEDKRSGDIARRYNREEDFDREHDAVVDLSLGGEIALLKSVALRGGFFTDFAASRPIRDDPSDVDRLRLDRYGGTLGLGFSAGGFDTTVGVVFVRGEGEFGVEDPVTREVVGVDSTETTGMLVLSGAVTIEEAKKKIREALPFEVPILPDLGSGAAPPAPRVPAPLPPESKPPPPALKSGPPPAPPVDPVAPDTAPAGPPVAPPTPSGAAPAAAPVQESL